MSFESVDSTSSQRSPILGVERGGPAAPCMNAQPVRHVLKRDSLDRHGARAVRVARGTVV